MNTLIELKFPYNYSAGIMSNGIIRVCDGKLFKEVDGNSYRPGYLKETSTIHHAVNLLKGGDLEAISDYVVDIVDDNLLSTLEMAGYSLNSGEVQVYLLDDVGIKTPIWFGYITGSELASNILSIKCENLTKSLKTLEKPVILGNCKNVKLERDTTLSNQTYTFVTNSATNYQSKHPIITEVYSPKYTGGSTNSYGILRVNSTSTLIKIKYFGSVFPWASGSDYLTKNQNYHLKMKWQSGANEGNGLRIKNLREVVVGDHVEAWITLSDDIQNTDIRCFDRIEIFDQGSYFLLPDGIDIPTAVAVMDSTLGFKVNASSYEVKTIGTKRYLIVYPSSDLYIEAPIIETSISSDSIISDINANIKINSTLALDNNYDPNNMCGVHVTTASGSPTQSYLKFTLKPDLSSFVGRQMFLGTTIDIGFFKNWGNTVIDPGANVKGYIEYKLKSGEVYPSSNGYSYNYSDLQAAGNFYNYGGNDNTQLRSTPPTTAIRTNTSGTLYNQPLDFPFIKSQLDAGKLVDPDVYVDIESISLVFIITSINASPLTDRDFLFYKIGIYAASEVSDIIDAVYIDYIGNASETSICGMDDRIAKEVLTTVLGQSVASDFVTSNPNDNYQHLYSIPGTTAEEALSVLAKESMSVIGSKEDREIYRKPLVITQDDAKMDLVISATEVISVEPLKDIALTDFINLPKISFKDPSGNVEWFEVTNLDFDTSAFPTVSGVNNGTQNYSSFFAFSDNFITTIRAKSTKSNGDIFLNWLLSSVWTECKTSYTKNATLRNGEISFETIYLNEFFVDIMLGYSSFMDIIKLNAQRRKTVDIVLPLEYGTTTPLRLGDRVKVFHPNLMQNNSLYGFLASYDISIFKAQTKISVLVDSFKLGDGTIDFF